MKSLIQIWSKNTNLDVADVLTLGFGKEKKERSFFGPNLIKIDRILQHWFTYRRFEQYSQPGDASATICNQLYPTAKGLLTAQLAHYSTRLRKGSCPRKFTTSTMCL
jgi:hypothetical protein